MINLRILFALFVLSATSALAQPELIKDIATAPSGMLRSDASNSNPFIQSGNYLYWTSPSGLLDKYGRELWRTDGTEAGTFRITDTNPGVGDGLTPTLAATDLNGGLIFVATKNGFLPYSFGKTDGTIEGTELYTQIKDGTISVSPEAMISFNNKVYFVAASNTASYFGVTDGTAEGTSFIKRFDLPAGTFKLAVGQIRKSTALIYFKLSYIVQIGSVRHEVIYQSDGTEGGTVQVDDIPEVNAMFGTVGTTLYYMKSRDLWKSDGVNAPELVKTNLGNPVGSMYAWGSKMFIPTSGGQWITDGTGPGTINLDFNLLNGGPAELNSKLYYLVQGSSFDEKLLMQTDGTPANTIIVGGLGEYTHTGGVIPMPVANSKVFLQSYAPGVGLEVATWDGTSINMLKDINPGPPSSVPTNFNHPTPLNDKLIFLADDGVHGTELWITDGTQANTKLLKDTRPNSIDATTKTARAYRANGSTFFTTNVAANSSDLKLHRVIDNPLDETEYDIPEVRTVLGVANDRLFFTTRDGLWMTNGAEDVQLKWYETPFDLTFLGSADNIVALGDKVIAQIATNGGDTENFGRELWVTDGTQEGTKVLKDINPGQSAGTSVVQTNTDGLFAKISESLMVFSGGDATTGYELWKTDGTEEGTALVKDIRTGTSSGIPYSLKAYDGIAYFAADNGVNGFELWRSDGTAEGTYMIKDINEGTGPGYPRLFVKLGSYIYFVATANGQNWSLWRTDGTEEGTTLVKDASVAITSVVDYEVQPLYLTVSAGKIFFAGSDEEHGRELWVSDGTTEGTHTLDLEEGPASSYPQFIAAVPGGVYFGAKLQLWRSNGDMDYTEMVADIDPGYISAFGSELFFNASDDVHGREYYRMMAESFPKADQEISFELEDHNFSEGSFELEASATSGLPVSFSAQPEDKLTIDGTTATINEAGLVTVFASQPGDDAFNEATDQAITICINPAKPAFITENGQLVPNTNLGIKWYMDGEEIEGEPTLDGDYTVTSSVDGCISPMSDPVNLIFTGLGEEMAGISFYPNPVKDYLYVSSINRADLEIISSTGQRLHQSSFSGSYELPVSYTKGIYFLKISVNDKVVTKKFLKE